MTKINVKEESLKLFEEFEKRSGTQLNQIVLQFIEYGMIHGIMLAGKSLMEFDSGEINETD